MQQALSLDDKDRASLAGAVVESLHGKVEPRAKEAWETMIKRRIEELEARAVETVPVQFIIDAPAVHSPAGDLQSR